MPCPQRGAISNSTIHPIVCLMPQAQKQQQQQPFNDL